MNGSWAWIALTGLWSGAVLAHGVSPVSIEVVSPDGSSFREIPVESRDGALRSYLQAERGARYRVRAHNSSDTRLGLVITVDGRNIIDGRKSELSRDEPMYVLDAGQTQDYAGWRASLDAINEFYFTDWQDSYAEAFGDRSARGVIAIAVYREARPERTREDLASEAENSTAAPAAKESDARVGDRSAGTGYGERREDHVREIEFVARTNADSRHFIKYEWRETLCRKRLMECGEPNRFWDDTFESDGKLGFAPPPPRHGRQD